MRFIRTALRAWGERKRGRGTRIPSLRPSQRQLKQVCVFTWGAEVNTSAILTWFRLDTLDHTLTLHPLEYPKTSLRGPWVTWGSHNYYHGNLTQPLVVSKWSWLKDISEQRVHQCQNFQRPCFEFRTPAEKNYRTLHPDASALICSHLTCTWSVMVNLQSHPTRSKLGFTHFDWVRLVVQTPKGICKGYVPFQV